MAGNEEAMSTLYCAQWIVPIATPPINDGCVVVEGTRIKGVGPRDDMMSRFPEAAMRDYGEAAILPGLVNCHTHLELTAMRGFLESEEADFFAWLRKLTVTKYERMTPEDFYIAAAWGAIEAARAGITCVGDASDIGSASLAALRAVGLRGTVYQEVFGPDPRLAAEQLAKLQDKVVNLREGETDLVRVGVSPHAPYTVSAPLLMLVTEYAVGYGLPMMMHAAESAAELALLRDGSGLFAENLAKRGIEWRAPGTSTIQYLAACDVLQSARPLLAHCITVDDADIDIIKETGAGVAHCPKSNAKLRHGQAPYSKFVANDIAVGFGSDSVASNNTCDMLEEGRFAALLSRTGGEVVDNASGGGADNNDSQPVIEAEDVLRTATLGGARALNLQGRIGVLAAGMDADLTIVRLDEAHHLPVYDPAAALVFAAGGRDVVLTVVAGREVYREGRVTTVDEDRVRERMREMSKRLTG